MTRNNPSKLIIRDLKIERKTLQNLRARIRQRAKKLQLEFEVDQPKVIAEPQRTMSKYMRPSLTRIESSIVRLIITANNFKIKPNIIQMVQQFVQFNRL